MGKSYSRKIVEFIIKNKKRQYASTKINISVDKNNKDYLYRLINLIVSVTRKNNNIATESFK